MTPTVALPDWLRPLAAALDDPVHSGGTVAVRPGVGARPAAVLVLLAEGDRGPRLMVIERAAGMRTHAGQIAFPGGAAEAADADLTATALREAREEVGVDPAGVEVVGSLPPAHVAVSGFDVTAVVGWWRQPVALAEPDPSEVAAVHLLDVDALGNPARRAQVRHPSNYVGPAFLIDDLVIWGLTAHLVSAVLQLGGWERPWDPDRLIEVPRRYLNDTGPGAGPGGPDAH